MQIARAELGRFAPGASGNPSGRPLSARNRIAERLIADISDAWEKHGAGVLDRLAQDDPGKFAQIAAGLVPKDILLTVTQRAPGNLGAEDWEMAMAVFAAIKQAMPDAKERSPAAVMEYVLAALRLAAAKPIEPVEG